MIFNSVEFLIFFIVVTSLYFILPQRGRWPMLLAASCFFYMFFKPIYIFILFFTITVDYLVGILLERTADQKSRKLILLFSIIANVGVLAVFKYYNFMVVYQFESFPYFSVNFTISDISINLSVRPASIAGVTLNVL